MSWTAGWLAGMAAAALVAVLELDVVQFGQFMISRPLVLGPLLGLLFGLPQTGLALGACCELFSLDDLPVGGSLPLNATVAVSAALLLNCGPRAVPPEVALPAGLTAGWLHQKIETALRYRRRALCGCAEESLLRGCEPRLGRLVGQAICEQAAMTFTVLLACVLVVGPALHWLWPHAPHNAVEALRFAWALAPWLGLGVLLHALKVTP